ncbi:MAG: PqqD family protein [Elusimicrobiota bacterium]|jgi:hypothetical protein
MSSLYERLARQAWSSGEYRSAGPDAKRSLREDGDALRVFIRSRVEWIVERCALRTAASAAAGAGLRLAGHVRFYEEAEGGTLLDIRGEKAWRLSGTAAAVVRELRAGCPEDVLFSRLRGRFSGDACAVEQEARSFLAELRERDWLENPPTSD